MFRILLLIILICYALYKLGLFRVIVGSAKDGYREPGNSRRPSDGNVNVDSAPPKGKRKSDFDGGDYVDYEEVK